MSLNYEGSLFIHSFDIATDRNHVQLFSLKGQKISHFCFLESEVVAAISESNKAILIVDTVTDSPITQIKT